MFRDWYARWMYAWETRLTTRDENRVVRPLEWGFEWIVPFLEAHGFGDAVPGPEVERDDAAAEAAMVRINQLLIRHSDVFFGYKRPTDFRLEERYPQLFPTNVRPETLAQDAELKQQAAEGKLAQAQFLRFTSPERTPYPENDLVNARWYPAPEHKDPARPKQAIVVLPQWNADGFSHNSLCTIFNRMGVSALRLSKPYHDIRRPGGAGALGLLRQRQYRPHHLRLPPGGGRYPLLPRLARRAGIRALRRAGNKPRLLLRVPGQRARPAHPRERLQSRVDGVWRRGVGRPKHAPCSPGARRGWPHAGSAARPVGRPSAPCTTMIGSPAPKPAAAENGFSSSTPTTTSRFRRQYSLKVVEAFRALRAQLRGPRASLRPLHHRRNSLQVHRRLAPRLVRLQGLQGTAARGGIAGTRESRREQRRGKRQAGFALIAIPLQLIEDQRHTTREQIARRFARLEFHELNRKSNALRTQHKAI